MKRLFFILLAMCLTGAASVAVAGDFHNGTNLVCSDCHVAHGSQSHGYTVGGTVFPPIGPGGPHPDLLRDEEVKLCLQCHNNSSLAPDVFGSNVLGSSDVRQAGGLNSASGHGLTNDPGYDEIDGHTLFSPSMPPGGTGTAYTVGAEGLVCTSCHAQHGGPGYRNLLHRGIFSPDTITYATGTNNPLKDVFQRSAGAYTVADVDFNEPSTSNSKYATWCQNCHMDFHGAVGPGTGMGGQSGGVTVSNASPWKRHPVADVNIGTPGGTHISDLARFTGVTNKVKVMDSQGLWTGGASDSTVTPSCMSCHKGHGNMNSFGMIFMKGTGTVTEEGDGGVYKDLCRQCHRQGA
jgi:hypothetical protein